MKKMSHRGIIESCTLPLARAVCPLLREGPRVWDTDHELGSLGRWDIWCIDFMYDVKLEIKMLEMTDSCLFKVSRDLLCPAALRN
jgi:hypothetical protein